MPRKRYKPEEIVTKLRQVDVLLSQGSAMADAIRQIGVSEVTFYRWRQEFGSLKTDQVKRLKELELEGQQCSSTGAQLHCALLPPRIWHQMLRSFRRAVLSF